MAAALVAGSAAMAAAQAAPVHSLVNAPGSELATSGQNPYLGSVQARSNSGQMMRLTLDEAIGLGVENNLALKLAEAHRKTIKAERLQVVNFLTPNLSLHAETGVHEYNLAAQGFHSSALAHFATLGPPGSHLSISPITRADVTNAQFNLSQELFSWAGWDALYAAHDEVKAVEAQTASSAGTVIVEVGNLYLEALAAGTRVDMAKSLLRSDKTALDQAKDKHAAGTVAHIAVLRAQVAWQQQQQAVLAAEAELMAGRPEHLILRVDRTDPSKNVGRGIRASEIYLAAHPMAREESDRHE